MRKGQKKGDYKGVELSKLTNNSTLNQDVLSSVETLFREGNSVAEICRKLEIPRSTFETWRANNTAGFETWFVNLRRNQILEQSEEAIMEALKNPDIKVRANMAQYASERLGRQWYSTRQETRQVEKQETLEETEQERLNKLLEKPQAKPIETPYTEKAL